MSVSHCCASLSPAAEGCFSPSSHVKAAEAKQSHVVIELLKKGADVTVTDTCDCTALHYAIKNKDALLLEYFFTEVFPTKSSYVLQELLSIRGGAIYGFNALETAFLEKDEELFSRLLAIYEKEMPHYLQEYKIEDLKVWIKEDLSKQEQYKRLIRKVTKRDIKPPKEKIEKGSLQYLVAVHDYEYKSGGYWVYNDHVAYPEKTKASYKLLNAVEKGMLVVHNLHGEIDVSKVKELKDLSVNVSSYQSIPVGALDARTVEVSLCFVQLIKVLHNGQFRDPKDGEKIKLKYLPNL
jgi:hypothetical protein